MAKRHPEQYQPGELTRTRNNLGYVSSEEARRIAEALGGQVGVEKLDRNIEEKYEKLRDLNRRKTDRIIPPPRVHQYSPETAGGQTIGQAKPNDERRRYLVRVRMNMVAARSEYQIKTITGAIASIFTGPFAVQDYINPKFLIRGDDIFFRHVEGLVLAVRGLLAINQKHPANRIRNPFFIQILSALKNWDIEGLHQELTHLQIAPRHLTFRHCGALTRHLFTPLIRLIDLAEGNSIVLALKRLYDLDLLSLPSRHPDVDRIKSHYHMAIAEYQHVFRILKRRCYPLLMKVAVSECLPVNTFYLAGRPEILSFLSLSEEDVLQIPGEADPSDSIPPEDVEEVAEETVVPIADMPSLQQGFELLERLFPEAGWNSLEEWPDMYPYFQPLLMFPRGFELVPPDDPFHQIVVLATVLQELFYGFRSIEFGRANKAGSGKFDIGAAIDSATDSWRQFLVELVSQHYLSTLYDYCREIEKSPQFSTSVYGAKQHDYLTWLKKLYLLPHLIVGRPKPSDASHAVPKLHIVTSELKDLLGIIATELATPENDHPLSVKNPWAQFAFEIESDISRRFKEVLRLYREDTTNANLLLYTYSILLLLDALLNQESSHFYPYPNNHLYRTEDDEATAPMYTVAVADPTEYFKNADEKIRMQVRPVDSVETVTRDRLTDVLNMNGLRSYMDQQIFLYRQQKVPFVLLSVLIRDFKEFCERSGEEAGIEKLKLASKIIKETIREYKDIPARAEDSLFMVLLPATVREESVNLAIRLFMAFQETEDEDLAVSLGIVQLEPTWGRDKLLKIARQAAKEAAGLPPPSLSIYDGKQNRFQTLSEVHGK